MCGGWKYFILHVTFEYHVKNSIPHYVQSASAIFQPAYVQHSWTIYYDYTYNNIQLLPSYINDILNGALLNLLTNAPISR